MTPNPIVRGDSYNCLTVVEDNNNRSPSPPVRPMVEVRGDSYNCLTDLNEVEGSGESEKRSTSKLF